MRRFLLLLLALGALNWGAALALPWRWSNPQPFGNNIYDLTHRDDTYIAVGDRGRVYTSVDLDVWIARETGSTETLRSITFLGNRALISGANGTIVWSDDLMNFSVIKLPTTSWLEGIVANGSMAVAVGDDGVIFTTTDGLNWTARASGTSEWLTSVTELNGTFYVAGENATLLGSSNGVTWQRPWLLLPFSDHLYTIANINGQIWAGGANGLIAALGSRGWTISGSAGTASIYAITGSSNTWVAVGDNAVFIRQGSSGAWQSQTAAAVSAPAPSWPFYTALWDGRLFLAGGRAGMLMEGFQTSATAPFGWYANDSPRSWLWSVTRAAGFYTTVGNNGTILTSDDGATWNQEVAPTAASTNILLGVSGRTNLLIAVGSKGTILNSPEAYETVITTNAQNQRVTNLVNTIGIRWNQASAPTTADLQGIAMTADLIVATGGSGTILTSSNGSTWSPRTSGVNVFLSSVTRLNGLWIATGDRGTILTSADAQQWTPRFANTTNWIYQARTLNNRAIAVGENGLILTSADGISWMRQNQSSGAYAGWINDVAFANGAYFAVSGSGVVLRSSDAIAWTEIDSITSQSLYGIANTGDQIVVVGTDGAVLRARTAVNAPVAISAFQRVGTANAFLFTGQLDQQFTLESSSNLQNWTVRATLDITDPNGAIVFENEDTDARMFYRTRATDSN